MLRRIVSTVPEVGCLLRLQFAVLLALVFAKIARIDYPRFWPSLVDDLLAVTAEGDGLRRRRAYLVLHHVLKELSSKRLAADQRTFAEVGFLPHTYNLNAECGTCMWLPGPPLLQPRPCAA